MGVELDRDDDDDDDDEEEEEEEVKGFELRRAGRRGRRGVEKKDSGYYSFLTEHPPVNPKTMGEGVRHTSSECVRVCVCVCVCVFGFHSHILLFFSIYCCSNAVFSLFLSFFIFYLSFFQYVCVCVF